MTYLVDEWRRFLSVFIAFSSFACVGVNICVKNKRKCLYVGVDSFRCMDQE